MALVFMITRLDRQMRQTTSMEWSINWSKQEPSNFLLTEMSDKEKFAVLVFATFNPNGFLREKAVDMLASYEMSLPYILLRKNDWVCQIREVAQNSFEYRLNNLSTGELLASLQYVEKLNCCNRSQHKPDTERFYNVLLDPKNNNELELGLSSDNQHTRAICANALLNAGRQNTERIIQFLKKENVPHIRLMTYKKLIAIDKMETESILELMLNDKYFKVKCFALQYVYEQSSQRAYQIAIPFLLDDNACVRNLARWIIAKYKPSYDYRWFYLNPLSDKIYATISGLGEVGTKDDIIFIKPYLVNDRERLIRAAMRSLMSIDNNQFGNQIMRMLEDNRIGVAKEAFQLLMHYGFYDYIDEIYNMFKKTQNSYSRKKCATFLFRCPKWEAIIYMLEALATDDILIRQIAEIKISSWIVHFNRSFTAPTSAKKRKINELIEKENLPIDVETSKTILFYLK